MLGRVLDQRVDVVVSIRTRPFGRVMLARIARVDWGLCVSIRTRPFGRVMPGTRLRDHPSRIGFNPHPAFRPGDAHARLSEALFEILFQSAPGLSAG